ncbi:related to Splicing factor U2AF-associated protein 2 [Sporisorium reilianum SRZ2]|uniref:Related to Splicing factor U2AF-associated protein 2 n=1 Tax=Sporisorium reilianum (strain SRZ2) TaxID=999809 RepID=E6ZL10_SPORE|nr:related to Splicing factor U2AF-associated protein 2 [Sporisorium reilianum SRZ2]
MHPAPPTASGSDDPRVYIDRLSGNWRYEDDDGEEWEWQTIVQHSRRTVDLGETEDDTPTASSSSSKLTTPPSGHWTKVLDDDTIRAQQAAYSIDGVDESQPAQAVLRRTQKRPASPTPTPSSKQPPAKKPKPVTSLYVTGLPLDASVDEIARVFSRYGVLLEDDQGQPRIKMYRDERTGMFKGEALVVYFKPESVELAIGMLDETGMRAAIGQSAGAGPVMRVQRAEFSSDASSRKAGVGASAKQNNGATSSGQESSTSRRNLTDQDRKKIAKRVARLETKLSDWRDDSPSPTASPTEPSTTTTTTTTAAGGGRTVVLTKMFTLHELDSDPTLLLDLKQDVRDECSDTVGGVTNVVLWDKEPEGLMTVRFQTEQQAAACVRIMKGRFFAQRRIDAWVIHGKPRFRKSANVDSDDEDADGDGEDEKKRKDAFGSWLEESA